jgi:alkylated DNA repair dioxygenase AlkB
MSHSSVPLLLPDADVRLWRQAIPRDEADAWFDELSRTIDWRTEEVLIYGQLRTVPRLVAWHGEPNASYSYSGTLHEPQPWTPLLTQIRTRVEFLTAHTYNSVLLNRYRDGSDGMGWHADDEPELGREPAIASLSLGETRRFRLRHRRRRETGIDLELGHGDLLLMAGMTQHAYLHAVPKTKRAVSVRLNLTWRRVFDVATNPH